ncbi:sodium:calcium antiporter [Candidatus Micrarchaeota archaeon]|nr:sodium:calcium antiporter [Candidatus Micrarchaeota archaeon]
MIDLIVAILTMFVSLVLLGRASGITVESAMKLSRYFRISQLAIGFLLLAFATSLPELSVSVLSSGRGEGAIAAGNIFGSNIANILLIIGLSAFLHGVRITWKGLREIGVLLLLTTLISAYIIFSGSVQNQVLGFAEGAILLLIFGAYCYDEIRKGRKYEHANHAKPVKKEAALNAFLLFCGSIVVVLASSGFVVDSAVQIAKIAGVAESFIGATIIAIGTSLPELSIGLQAVKKRRYAIFLGNAIGSNMINLTLILGIGALINPIYVQLPIFVAALLFAIAANTILLYVASVHRGLGKAGGALFLLVYAVYIVTIFFLQLRELGG